MLNPLILNIYRLFQRKKTSIPTVGQWYTTPDPSCWWRGMS